MAPRTDLQTLLQGLQDGIHVYFQPPPNVTMIYPAIVYNRDFQDVDFADNIVWYRSIRYQVTVIDPDPDSDLPDKVGELPLSRYVRHFTTENLNHDVYDLYY